LPASLSLILPTYNEGENIGELLRRIESQRLGVPFEVIVVDDGSVDGTVEEAARLNGSYGNIIILRRGRKMGLASAVLAGFKVAGGETFAVMDADLQHPPELLPRLYQKLLDGADVVVASRYAGGEVLGWPLHRRLVSAVATAMAHVLLPRTKRVKDPLSGYFLAKRAVVEGIDLKPKGYKILLEVLAKGRYSSVEEVPFTFGRRERGSSKLRVSGIIEYLHQLLLLSDYRPLKFAAVGASGAAVNEMVLWTLSSLGVPVPLASALAIETSVISNFSLNDSWTFSERRQGRLVGRAWRYHLSVASGVAVNYVTLLVLAALHLDLLLSNFVGIALGFVANYLTSESYAWKS